MSSESQLQHDQIAEEITKITKELNTLKCTTENQLGFTWFGVQTLYDKVLEIKYCAQSYVDKHHLSKDQFFSGLLSQINELLACVEIERRSYSLAIKENEIEDINHVNEINSVDKDFYEAMDKLEESNLKISLVKEKLSMQINENRLLELKNRSLEEENKKLREEIDEIRRNLTSEVNN
ncbi:unnamed protein product [Blepharisma stoltei]|uniref:Uncharacterized protein n=1 Tax=Blepharisma stoltei TaxID=1481888 RepID=A0AAU9JT40_9CILI|nr:unnamed protein product [Blepharisma stoltei]